jgi:hypothetical protein
MLTNHLKRLTAKKRKRCLLASRDEEKDRSRGSLPHASCRKMLDIPQSGWVQYKCHEALS